MASSPHTLLRCLRVFIGLEPSAVRNCHRSLPSPYLHNIRHFALLLCGTHVTDGAPMILVELDSVAIWWVSKKLYPASHLKEK
jgi:hypothetical protein